MDILDEFDINIIKELEKDGRMAYSAIATNLKISNTMVHQRINRLIEQGILTGIKPVINEKKVGYDWGSFTGITLNNMTIRNLYLLLYCLIFEPESKSTCYEFA